MSLFKIVRDRLEANRRSRKAISTIMANLTMLVIVVALSSLLFVWAISSFGAYQGGAGYWFSSRSIANQERLSIEGAYLYTCPSGSPGCTVGNSYALIYVRNVGTIPFTIAAAYLNQTLYAGYSGICSGTCDFQMLQYNVSQVVPIGIPPSQVSNPGAYAGLCMSGSFCKGQALLHGSWTITVATQRGTVISTTVVY